MTIYVFRARYPFCSDCVLPKAAELFGTSRDKDAPPAINNIAYDYYCLKSFATYDEAVKCGADTGALLTQKGFQPGKWATLADLDASVT